MSLGFAQYQPAQPHYPMVPEQDSDYYGIAARRHQEHVETRPYRLPAEHTHPGVHHLCPGELPPRHHVHHDEPSSGHHHGHHDHRPYFPDQHAHMYPHVHLDECPGTVVQSDPVPICNSESTITGPLQTGPAEFLRYPEKPAHPSHKVLPVISGMDINERIYQRSQQNQPRNVYEILATQRAVARAWAAEGLSDGPSLRRIA